MRKRITPKTNPPIEELNAGEIIQVYKSAFNVINRTLFNGELPQIDIYFAGSRLLSTEDAELTQDAGALAYFLFDEDEKNKPTIVLNPEIPAELGIDTETLQALFHEMIHYYCYLLKIKDHIGEYHTLQFKKAVEEHGGSCFFEDKTNGYSKEMLPKTLLNKMLYEI